MATANLDFLALARKDARLLSNLQNSSLVVADGMPVVWLARLVGARRVRRTAGVDLVQALCKDAGDGNALRIAMYGSTKDLTTRAAKHLESLSPHARVVTAINPPFRPLSPGEAVEHSAALAEAAPNLVLVAMGCPEQERVIADWYHHIPSALWVGVGGTFDFLAGERKRAPRLFRATGTEWIVRMVQEPTRLGRRYLGRDLPALVRIMPGCLLQRLRRADHSS